MYIVVLTRNEDLLKAQHINDRFGQGDPWVQFRNPDEQVKGIQPDGIIIDYETIPEAKNEDSRKLMDLACSNGFNLVTDEGLVRLRTKMISDYKKAEREAEAAHQRCLDGWEDSFRNGYCMK